MKKSVALFFGSFNPIHIGHCIIADHVAQQSEIDEVWLVVSPHNPLKDKKTLLADHHRLAMVQRAIEDNPRLKASAIEFNLPQPNYTVHTLAYLAENHPHYSFSIVMGQDNIRQLPRWKNYEQILKQYTIWVYPRQAAGETAALGLQGQIKFLENMPSIQLSSSQIRAWIKSGRDVKYLMPEAAYIYCREMHFYEK